LFYVFDHVMGKYHNFTLGVPFNGKLKPNRLCIRIRIDAMLYFTECDTASDLFWGGKRKTRKTIGINVQQTIRRWANTSFFLISDPRKSLGKLKFHGKSAILNYEPCCGPEKMISRKLGVSTSIVGCVQFQAS